MEDTIEICSGCGKMPRPVDRMDGYFVCSRCGNRSTIMVIGDDYENVATDLDQKFHETLLRTKAAEAKKHEPVIHSKNPGKKTSKVKKKTAKTEKKAVKTTKKKPTKKKKK